jgi:hypothetical protein
LSICNGNVLPFIAVPAYVERISFSTTEFRSTHRCAATLLPVWRMALSAAFYFRIFVFPQLPLRMPSP